MEKEPLLLLGQDIQHNYGEWLLACSITNGETYAELGRRIQKLARNMETSLKPREPYPEHVLDGFFSKDFIPTDLWNVRAHMSEPSDFVYPESQSEFSQKEKQWQPDPLKTEQYKKTSNSIFNPPLNEQGSPDVSTQITGKRTGSSQDTSNAGAGAEKQATPDQAPATVLHTQPRATEKIYNFVKDDAPKSNVNLESGRPLREFSPEQELPNFFSDSFIPTDLRKAPEKMDAPLDFIASESQPIPGLKGKERQPVPTKTKQHENTDNDQPGTFKNRGPVDHLPRITDNTRGSGQDEPIMNSYQIPPETYPEQTLINFFSNNFIPTDLWMAQEKMNAPQDIISPESRPVPGQKEKTGQMYPVNTTYYKSSSDKPGILNKQMPPDHPTRIDDFANDTDQITTAENSATNTLTTTAVLPRESPFQAARSLADWANQVTISNPEEKNVVQPEQWTPRPVENALHIPPGTPESSGLHNPPKTTFSTVKGMKDLASLVAAPATAGSTPAWRGQVIEWPEPIAASEPPYPENRLHIDAVPNTQIPVQTNNSPLPNDTPETSSPDSLLQPAPDLPDTDELMDIFSERITRAFYRFYG